MAAAAAARAKRGMFSLLGCTERAAPAACKPSRLGAPAQSGRRRLLRRLAAAVGVDDPLGERIDPVSIRQVGMPGVGIARPRAIVVAGAVAAAVLRHLEPAQLARVFAAKGGIR